jgi:hypothetical protein
MNRSTRGVRRRLRHAAAVPAAGSPA